MCAFVVGSHLFGSCGLSARFNAAVSLAKNNSDPSKTIGVSPWMQRNTNTYPPSPRTEEPQRKHPTRFSLCASSEDFCQCCPSYESKITVYRASRRDLWKAPPTLCGWRFGFFIVGKDALVSFAAIVFGPTPRQATLQQDRRNRPVWDAFDPHAKAACWARQGRRASHRAVSFGCSEITEHPRLADCVFHTRRADLSHLAQTSAQDHIQRTYRTPNAQPHLPIPLFRFHSSTCWNTRNRSAPQIIRSVYNRPAHKGIDSWVAASLLQKTKGRSFGCTTPKVRCVAEKTLVLLLKVR